MNSTSTYINRALLFASGLLAAGIAASILIVPDSFYASYGIEIGKNTDLTNELKAPSGGLFVAGILMLLGAVKPAHAKLSLTVGAVIFLSYGLSRLLSFALDGMPNSALVNATILELALGVMCALGLARLRPEQRRVGRSRKQGEVV